VPPAERRAAFARIRERIPPRSSDIEFAETRWQEIPSRAPDEAAQLVDPRASTYARAVHLVNARR